MATRTVDWKGGAAVEKTLRTLQAKYGTADAVQVGFFEDERYTSKHPTRGTPRKPLPVATVAFWNNYGTSRTPRRDFMGATVRGNVGWWARDFAALLETGLYTNAQALAILGLTMKEDLVTMITRWSQPANAPRTIAIKGFNKPLVDDGAMQRAPGFSVNGGTPQK